MTAAVLQFNPTQTAPRPTGATLDLWQLDEWTFMGYLPDKDIRLWAASLIYEYGDVTVSGDLIRWTARPWSKRWKEDPWRADEILEWLNQRWLEDMAPVMPEAVPSPAPPPVEVSKGKRGLIVMAQEMGIPADELERRIDSGGYNIIVTERASCEGQFDHHNTEGYKGIWKLRYDYSFNLPDARHNIAHGHEEGKVKIRKEL